MQNIEICSLLVCPDSLISSNDCHTQLTIKSVVG